MNDPSFRIERDSLVAALVAASRAVSGRTSLPALNGVRVTVTDQVEIVGSDLDTTIRATVPATVKATGVVVIPGRILTDVIKAAEPGAVDIAVDGDDVAVSAGRFVTELRCLPPSEFPRLDPPEGDAVIVSAAAFNGALTQVLPAASHDEARPIINGVLIAAEGDGLRLVATDSYRLAVKDLPGLGSLVTEPMLVPHSALTDAVKVFGLTGDLSFVFEERHLTIQSDTVSVSTRLIEGEFPNYKGLLPDSTAATFTTERAPFTDAVRRVALMAREHVPVRFSFHSEGVDISSITQDVGSAIEQVDGTLTGLDDLEIAFNPQFFLAGLEACGGDRIVLGATATAKPAVMRTEGVDDFLYLQMPIRV